MKTVTRAHCPAPTFVALLCMLTTAPSLLAQTGVTSPREQFGFGIGDDYQLATYSQLAAYWQQLADESPRMTVVDIGPTAEGRTQWMAIVTAPENFERLDRYKEISRRLALADDLTQEDARSLAREGKAVVWIDGGLHADEVVGAQQLIQLSYELTSFDDEETLRFLKDAIILLAPVNPDGMELVSDWYMRESEPTRRSTDDLPRLYQKYIGHDNNRDYYRVAQPETENATHVLFREWFPQLTYNHHQTGPNDIFVFVPPFREPPGYFYDPLLVLGNQAVGLHMHQRLASEGKPGAGMRSRATYSTWYNGSIRTVGYYHNQIGMLTEMKGHPTPMELAFFPDRMLAQNDFPMPIIPGVWYFQQSIDYSMTLNRAFLDYASRNRERVLYDRYIMGRRNIEKGSTDTWTVQPRTVYEVEDSVLKTEWAPALEFTFRRRGPGIPKDYLEMFRKPEDRDPRGFILPSDQADFPTAVVFLNTLIKNGVEVLRATSDFEVHGTAYRSGSYVVKSAQAFRPHVMDMFEPQDHPDDFLYVGGPPVPPYDNGGWTLAFQMGVEFDRILEGFDGPFEAVEGLATHFPGTVVDASGAAGFLLSHEAVNSVTATNRLMAAGHDVYWLSAPVSAGGRSHPAGTIFVEADGSSTTVFADLAQELGLDFQGVRSVPAVDALRLNPVRVGLWDEYGGSMPSGWTRWILEQHEFPYEVVFAPALDDGDLDQSFDALVFPTDAVPGVGTMNSGGPEVDPATIPSEYRDHLGRVTAETTIPQLKRFLESGGHVTAIGTSTSLASHLGLPFSSHLVNRDGDPLPPEEFYIPSSVLQIRVDNTQPLAYGVSEHVDVMYDESPVFRLAPDAEAGGVIRVGWFDNDQALRSGWAWGEDRLYGGTAIAEAEVGEGRLHLFGPEILFRAQPYGTFNFFFNSLFLATAEKVRLGPPVSE